MSQIVHGQQLGAGIYDLVAKGTPSSRRDLAELYSAQVGSTYRNISGSAGSILFVCTTSGIPATGGNTGVISLWTAYA
jgi:hypothetical protein